MNNPFQNLVLYISNVNNPAMEKFIEQLGILLYKTSRNRVTDSTRFKELEEWNLLFASSLLTYVNEEYDVQLNAIDLEYAETFGDLYQIVQERSAFMKNLPVLI